MTLANMRGLHDPVRSEREAQLEAENKVMREALEAAEVLAQTGLLFASIELIDRVRDLRRTALSTTASRGGAA